MARRRNQAIYRGVKIPVTTKAIEARRILIIYRGPQFNNGGRKVKNINYSKPSDYLGRAIKVFLKDGGAFNYKVTGSGPNYLDGYDDEGLNITINVEDIDYIIGGHLHG